MAVELGNNWSMGVAEDLGDDRRQLEWLLSVRLTGPFDLRSQQAYKTLCHRERDLLDEIESSPPEYSVL
jgi:hypothetical protein